jgi:hypothetical protein
VVTQTTSNYADDTRGVYVPSHQQHRFATGSEQLAMQQSLADEVPFSQQQADHTPRAYAAELNRIAQDPGLIARGHQEAQQHAQQAMPQQGLAVPQQYPPMMAVPQSSGYMPMVIPMPVPMQPMGMQGYAAPAMPSASTPQFEVADLDSGSAVWGKEPEGRTLDMHNSIVSLREDRVSVRRALQRMMDQIGGGDWVIVWDLVESNAGLPETEVSIHAEEPFAKVMNALLARVQARSGQPLRVVRYDRTQRLVITDRAPGDTMTTRNTDSNSIGVGGSGEAAVTENVLKETLVSLHYDEVPLVDALENVVHQAGKGQWRLRMYAGMDQVLKPAHIEEPFGVALERLLKLFNLKYEIFPGGKLIVITNNSRFGFDGVTP